MISFFSPCETKLLSAYGGTMLTSRMILRCLRPLLCLAGLHVGVAAADSVILPTGMSLISVASSPYSATFDAVEAPAVASPRNCLFGLWYIDLSTAGGRAIYATVLLARMAGKKLQRIDWTKDASGLCTANFVMIADP